VRVAQVASALLLSATTGLRVGWLNSRTWRASLMRQVNIWIIWIVLAILLALLAVTRYLRDERDERLERLCAENPSASECQED
jgi:histidinol-phosphate/aromatic aminotransferase/cobyric acid decarboxylase-like protein